MDGVAFVGGCLVAISALFALVLLGAGLLILITQVTSTAADIVRWVPRFCSRAVHGDRVAIALTLSTIIFFGPLVLALFY